MSKKSITLKLVKDQYGSFELLRKRDRVDAGKELESFCEVPGEFWDFGNRNSLDIIITTEKPRSDEYYELKRDSSGCLEFHYEQPARPFSKAYNTCWSFDDEYGVGEVIQKLDPKKKIDVFYVYAE